MKAGTLAAILLAMGCARTEVTDMATNNDEHDVSFKGHVEVATPALTRIREFHGHVGPYVVLGYRMGLLAREILESPGYFDLNTRVQSPPSPPASCLVDGLQLGSGCTVGKGNLTVTEGARGRAVFETEAGKTATLSLRPEVPEKIQKWIAEEGVERAGLKLLDHPADELFEVESP